ncbi:MAG: OB-fold nucleic acid binding domain-containing protein [Oscillospiraceae bacterium]
MGNLRRTKYCGRLRVENVGEEITVAGSCAKCRDKGGVIFADLRDTSGILQLIFDDGTDREIFEKYYPNQAEMITDFWMPNKEWKGCAVNDPSARVLSNYGASGL